MLKGDLGITRGAWSLLPFTSSFLKFQASAVSKRTKNWSQEAKAVDERLCCL